MNTQVIDARDSVDRDAISAAAEALRDGALVLFPTETVYGIAANAAHADALERLRRAKGRSEQQPFTVHLGQRAHAARFAPDAPVTIRRLGRRAWPGPLTLVCPVKDPSATPIAGVTPASQLGEIFHNNTVGLRCPDQPVGRQLLAEAEGPIVATSANHHGRPPATEFESALSQFRGVVAYAIDGGPSRLRGASTVVDLGGGEPRVLREGAIPLRAVQRMTQMTVLMVCTGNSCRSPLAEHLFRQHLARSLGIGEGDLGALGYRVVSAGTAAVHGAPMSQGSVDELGKRRGDGSQHRSQPLTPELLNQADVVYVMTRQHRAEVVDVGGDRTPRVELLDVNDSIMDPIGGGALAYEQAAEQIERAVAARVEELVNEDRDW